MKARRPIDRSSAKRPPTRTNAEQFALAGASNPPDPRFNAYRKDLADAALAGIVIASHYADPVERELSSSAHLRDLPNEESPAIAELIEGTAFALLDDSRGWAWGYAGDEGLVGYVPSSALS